jgi:transcription-repair coupling factor (superfamily II helicase)
VRGGRGPVRSRVLRAKAAEGMLCFEVRHLLSGSFVVTSAAQSLSLRSLLQVAIDQAGLVSPAPSVAGLSGAAKALAVAAAARQQPVLIVVPSDRDLDTVLQDLRFFLSALEGWSESEAERQVLPFPSQEVDPYRGLAPHFEVASARARALYGLASATARAVVASAGALMPRLSPADRLRGAAIELRTGEETEPTLLAELLVDAGYSREDPVDEHGEFAMRGGVIDFFPAGETHPYRIEFLGDTIESIRRFDPATQRSVETVDRATVFPLREQFALRSAAVEEERPDRSASILDYLVTPRRVRVFVSEWDDVQRQIVDRHASIEASYGDALKRSDRVEPPSALIVSWDELESALAGATRLDELALGDTGPLDTPSENLASSDHVPALTPATSLEARRGQASVVHVACQPARQFHGRVPDWVADLRRAHDARETVLFVAATSGRAERTIELLAEYGLVALPIERAEVTTGASLLVATGRLSQGFRLPDARLHLFAETDIFDEERLGRERRHSATRTFLSDFRDLKVGDLVVHVDHGIGVFVGLKKISVGVDAQEFMELRYAGDDKLFVPVERLDLVQKYSGGARPSLDRLGGTTWEKAKTRVKKAMRDMAGELLKLYAARKAVRGFAFSPDTHWQEEFENAFEFELTPDQQTAIADIKRDMEVPSPMDRLLCGDVGYGKTEVAMRAAFKAVMDGRQVAVLAPTTVLALQHLKTLRSRFAAFPMRIDMVSRFRTKQEQKETLDQLAEGKLDIIVGTHRLLSQDVQFKDLGLLVVDEEQRFGVAHKERIKQMRRKIDVLTMSATPIPRTLNMSLVGIRDMSIIETPPRDRLAIQTNVVKFDQKVIAGAIRQEMERGGQVYFVHNRVESIYSMGALLRRLVPEARIVIGHGQMGEGELEKVMVDFIERKHDVLLASTIIENGLDIPNANTMVVNRADRYGLAQLYQLRGRVGRSDRHAYAYLLVPPQDALSPIARKRLAAIREFSDLGSGFRVAALDLEIRGAGNLLGGEQSGHIEAIGFEMYMKLLEETIRELKGEDLIDDVRATVNLKVDLRIDERYVPDMNQRLGVYRKVAAVRSEEELERAVDEVRDRYGPLPISVQNLATYARIRVLADRLRVETIDREGQVVVFKFRQDAAVDPVRLVNLLKRRPDVQMRPPAVLRLDLKHAEVAPVLSGTRRPGGAEARPGAGRPGRVGRSTEQSGQSWWTKRATAEVGPGFTKENLTRQAAEDPRTQGGLFDRVFGLLTDLTDRA